VLLTEAGASYSHNVRARLDEVERDTLELMAKGGAAGALELGVLPTFATKWLLPRVPAFQQAHPGITLHFTPRTRPFLFEDTVLDAALYAGEAGWPGTEATFLMHENLIVVASPTLVPKRRLKPAELARYPLLQISTRPYLWRQWFEAAGVEVQQDLAGSRMELFSMVSEAAVHGLGVALVPRFLVEAELASGALRQLLDVELRSDRAYYLIYPERKADDVALVAFRDWIEGEASSYRAQHGLG
jgi:LysR family glycine cleavage system transcriptional activator